MRKPVIIFLMTAAAALGAIAQSDPVAVLQSDAPLFEKQEACRLLSTSGRIEAIPVLEPLLADAELADMARYALEPMPGTEADAALRRALSVTSGKLKAGVVSSLGVRRDADAVPAIIPLLNNEDGYVKEAAARALGRIGASEGVNALESAIAQPGLAYAFAQSLADGIFFAAETLAAGGNASEAARLYDTVCAVEALPVHLRAGALRGAILSRGPAGGGHVLILEALQEEDPDFLAVALRAAQEMEGKRKTAVKVAALLSGLSPERKVPVIQLLGELGKKKAGPALLKEAESGPAPVRVAALEAATRLGYAPVLPLVTSLITSEEETLAAAARKSLAYFPGEKGDDALRDLLKSNDARVRCIAVELVGTGALPTPVDLLMAMANEDAEASVRLAALKGAKEYAGAPQMPAFLEHLRAARSPEEGVAAEEGLIRICERARTAPETTVVITKAVYGDLPDGPQADVTERVRQLLGAGVFSVDANNANFGDAAPGAVKQLRVEYTDGGVPASQTVQEGQTLNIAAARVPAAVVSPLIDALAASEGETRLALIRVLTTTGDQKAFETILALTKTEDATLAEAAARAACDWPAYTALPTLLGWVESAPDDALRARALRGAVRLLVPGQDAPETVCQHFAWLLTKAASPNEKKLVLSGLSGIGHAAALTLVLDQIPDEAVKAEAVQAAITIAGQLGASPEDVVALERAKTLVPEINTDNK